MKNSTSSGTQSPPTHQDCTLQPKSTRKTIHVQLDLLWITHWLFGLWNLKGLIADLLNPLIGNTKHHVKNSKDPAEELSLLKRTNFFNSHDVVSLFTNTPIKESLDIIKKRLMEDKDLKKRTNLSVDSIIELLKFILTTTYFEFRGIIYRCFGAAMGSSVIPVVANFLMQFLEQHAIATAPLDCQPRLWKRYVDDFLEIIQKGQVQALTDHLNQVDTTRPNSVKFTHEEEKEGKIPFLDKLIIRKPQWRHQTLSLQKTHSYRLVLEFHVRTPSPSENGCKKNPVRQTELGLITKEEEDRLIEEERIRAAVRMCGYSEWAIKKVKDQMAKKSQAKASKAKPMPKKKFKQGHGCHSLRKWTYGTRTKGIQKIQCGPGGTQLSFWYRRSARRAAMVRHEKYIYRGLKKCFFLFFFFF